MICNLWKTQFLLVAFNKQMAFITKFSQCSMITKPLHIPYLQILIQEQMS